MRESKMELKNWKRWKNTLHLLNKTKENLEILNNVEFNNIKIDKIHQDIHQKREKVLEESKYYEVIIKDYEFFINRLELSINQTLNDEEQKIVIIYANNPDNALAREYEALENGISRTTYYKQLSIACNKLDKVLTPGANCNISNYITKTTEEL